MNYFLDTEFDGMGGPLLSMGLVREDGLALYATLRLERPIQSQWVKDNVMKVMYDIPSHGIDYKLIDCKPYTLAVSLGNLLMMDPDNLPNIVADWPDDIKYFCEALIVGPGQMVDTGPVSFLIQRVDAYPTDLPGAVRHNAYWDAMALRHHFTASDNDD